MIERCNRTLLNMLGTPDPSKKCDWKAHVATLTHSYNATKHDSTAQCPYFLMFGRQPRLPIYLALGLPDLREEKSIPGYVSNLRKQLREAYQLANVEAEKAREDQKTGYDKRARAGVLDIGDRVLVKVLAFTGKHKLADGFEEDPYVVVEQKDPNIPVYIVRREDGKGKPRTLHRNHLLPVNNFPIPTVTIGREEPAFKESKPKRPSRQEHGQDNPVIETTGRHSS